MRQLKCTDACPEGVSGCDYVIEDETDEKIIQKMKTHASIVHSHVMDEMTPVMMEGWVERAKGKITTV